MTNLSIRFRRSPRDGVGKLLTVEDAKARLRFYGLDVLAFATAVGENQDCYCVYAQYPSEGSAVPRSPWQRMLVHLDQDSFVVSYRVCGTNEERARGLLDATETPAVSEVK